VVGTTLLHYRIVASVGGGMGEVYAAEDTRLNGRVALKLLPPATATDPERLVRFRREAQAIAALNHPKRRHGRVERMHLALKLGATNPAAANVLQQQARFDTFVEEYNRERPHQALAMLLRADLYARSARVYCGWQT
jgi:serine/threonine protein kinase